jgi:ribose 5-phosphate isomerase B
MEIHLGADHRGYALKQQLAEYLRGRGHSIIDHGTDNDARTDYPLFGKKVAEAVVNGGVPDALGIVICGSGVGISIAANKVSGARCAVTWCEHIAEYSRRHNHANILAFSADLQTLTTVQRCVDAYLAAEPEGGRHAERVAMLEC